MNFEITKNGYSQDQVNAYIKMISDKYTEMYTAQQNQTEQLKARAAEADQLRTRASGAEQMSLRIKELELTVQRRESELAAANGELLSVKRDLASARDELSRTPKASAADAELIGQVLIEAKRFAVQLTDQARFESEKIKAEVKTEKEKLISVKREIVKKIQSLQSVIELIGDKDEIVGGAQPGIPELPLLDFDGMFG